MGVAKDIQEEIYLSYWGPRKWLEAVRKKVAIATKGCHFQQTHPSGCGKKGDPFLMSKVA